MGSKIFFVIIVLLLAIVAILAFRNYQLQRQLPEFWPRTTSTRPSPAPVVKTGLPSDWQTFTSFKNVYSFKYPGGANIEEFQDAVRLARKDNSDAPAGIFIDFRLGKLPTRLDLKTYVEQQIDTTRSGGKITHPLTEMLINSYSSYMYAFRGLGEEKHYYVPRFDGETFMHIVDSTTDSSTRDFKGTADNIVQTFSFTQ